MINLKVETHDGHTYTIEVEEYDPVKLNDQLNSTDVITVVIGDLVISRINIKSVIPE